MGRFCRICGQSFLPAFILFFFQVIVIYYSYKLRKINKKMKERQLEASSVYMNAASLFSITANLEELNEQFTKLRAFNESGNALLSLVRAYERQKEILKRET